MSKIIIPPIKSQGIKTKLVPWIISLIDDKSGVWIEPFMGTGVVGFNSGFKSAILSDKNPHLINFYNSLKEGIITHETVREFLEFEGRLLFSSADNGYEHYRRIRNRFNEKFSPLDFLFLSRAGFNGLIRFNSKGSWNVPFCKKPNRFSKSYITKIVNQVEAVSRICSNNYDFLNCDFKDSLEKAKNGDLIYCDPPYIDRNVNYFGNWGEKEEFELFEILSATKAKFIMSTWHHNDFRENSYINKLWGKFNILTKEHFYHAGGKVENRGGVTEALIMNF